MEEIDKFDIVIGNAAYTEQIAECFDVAVADTHKVAQRLLNDIVCREKEEDRKQRNEAAGKCRSAVLLEELLQFFLLFLLIIRILSLDLRLLVRERLLLHHRLGRTHIERNRKTTNNDRQENDRQTIVSEKLIK